MKINALFYNSGEVMILKEKNHFLSNYGGIISLIREINQSNITKYNQNKIIPQINKANRNNL